MRILNSSRGDPMLLGTETQLQALHTKFDAFIASPDSSAIFVSETDGSPAPADEFLMGLRALKNEGDPKLSISSDRWLELSASPDDLRRFRNKLLVKESEGHTHWYCKPVSLIIEADNTWPSHES